MTSITHHTASATFELESYRSLDDQVLTDRINAVRGELGPRLLILGHHYQRDEVIALADLRGDSYRLSQLAAEHEECRAIAFCGVHFMAEIDQVEDCWDQLSRVIDVEEVMPVTYVNSAASLKAFCGRLGGIVCTSANAAAVLRWAFARRKRVLFFPDQHLGRNTALAMGISLEKMPVWDPSHDELGGNTEEAIEESRVVLWRGHCSVHQMFLPQHVDRFRQRYPGIKILVHPECTMEVVAKSDVIGSTGKIIRAVEEAPPGTRWAIGTELHLVNRLKHEHPEQEIHFLSPVVCMCATMYRIDLAHLCWSLENLAAGTPVNVIELDDETARYALIALQRMLEVK